MKNLVLLVGLLLFFITDPPPVAADTLAVEFTSFDASVVGDVIKLDFSTEGTSYPEYFFVESMDLSGKWVTIPGSFIYPKTNQSANYTYHYQKPPDGQNYLRVGQKDYDGTFTYTNTEDVYFEASSIVYYPNPTNGQLTIYPKPDSAIVIDMSGRRNLYKPDNSGIIDLSELPRGFYSLQTIYNDNKYRRKTALVQRE